MNKQILHTMSIVIFALAFAAGWTINDFYHDSLELTAQKVAEKTRNDIEKLASQSAAQLEDKLEGIANAAPREIHTEIIKPIFTHICVSDDFIRMYNQTVEQIERELSGKSATQMQHQNTKARWQNRP